MMESRHRAKLKAAAELVRHPYAWPGGYPLYAVTSDGCPLSAESVKACWKQIAYAHIHNLRDGWYIEGIDINWEDADLHCDHSGKLIPSAYCD